MEVKIWSKVNGFLIIKPVSKTIAKNLIINNHYSKKWNNAGFGLYNYGIFRKGLEEESDCLGVAVYGYLMHPKAKQFTHPNDKAVILELNRMWISDKLGKNSESMLIAHSLKLLKKENVNIVAVQSFADGRLGCGTIYKASNFKYYGAHKTTFYQNKRTGEVTHEMNLTRMDSKSIYLRNNMAFMLGDLRPFKVDTYRYIYSLCKRFKSKFKEKPYPPYKKGIEYIDKERDRELIKTRLKSFIDDL